MKFDYYVQKLDDVLAESEGVVTLSDAKANGIPKDAFYRYVDEMDLEKCGRGIYLSKNAFPDELALLQARFPKVVFSHDTALFLHGLSEREPISLSVSVGSNYNSLSLRDQDVHIYYVKPEWYKMGICKVKTPEGNFVRAYDKERTICDMIRKRAATDITEFNYAMKTYVRSKNKNLSRLSKYASAMNMESRIWDAIGVLL